jgi:hypothetical protein
MLRYGPWSVDGEERRLQLRTLAALVHVMIPRRVFDRDVLLEALRASEKDEAHLEAALQLFEALPALVRRHILATHAAVTWPRYKKRGAIRENAT